MERDDGTSDFAKLVIKPYSRQLQPKAFRNTPG
jgi:hypothetical protein